MQDPDSPSTGGGGEGSSMITNPQAIEILKRALERKNEMVGKEMKAGAEVITDPDSEGPVAPEEDLDAKKGAS